MKKTILLSLASIIVLTGCTNNGSTTQQPVELNYWGLFEPNSNVQEVIDEYQQLNPHVKIKYTLKNLKEYKEQVQARAGQPNGPDIFRFHNSWMPMLQQDLAVVPSNITNELDFNNSFYPVVLNDLQLKTGYAGIPLTYDGLGLYYNKQIFRSRGLDKPPRYWDEVMDTAKMLTVAPEGKIEVAGLAMGAPNVDHWPDILALLIYQNNGNPHSAATKPEAIRGAVEYFLKAESTDSLWDSSWTDSTEMFAQGKVAMYMGTSWRAFEIQAKNPSLEFAIAPVPQLPGVQVGLASYYVEGVSNKIDQNKQTEAWKFLSFLAKKENQQKLYAKQASTRLFGEPPSHTALRDTLLGNQYLSGILETAPNARSTYLSDKTFASGINQEFIDAYREYLEQPENTTLNTALQSIQTKYGLPK